MHTWIKTNWLLELRNIEKQGINKKFRLVRVQTYWLDLLDSWIFHSLWMWLTASPWWRLFSCSQCALPISILNPRNWMRLRLGKLAKILFSSLQIHMKEQGNTVANFESCPLWLMKSGWSLSVRGVYLWRFVWEISRSVRNPSSMLFSSENHSRKSCSSESEVHVSLNWLVLVKPE